MKANPWARPFVVQGGANRYAHLERRAVAQSILGDSVATRAEILKARMREIYLCGTQVSSLLDNLLAIGQAQALSYYSSPQQILGSLYRADPWGDATQQAVMVTGLAGTGKTQLIQAMRRHLLSQVGSVDLPGHKNLSIKPAWFMSLRDGSTLNSLLRPCLMPESIDGEDGDVLRKKDFNQSQLLAIARRVSRRDGVCIIAADEFQFITRSLHANTLAMVLLLQLLSMGPRVVYVANYSLVRRLMNRRQEDRHRVLGNHLELRPDTADGADFLNYVQELALTAPGDFRFDAAEIAGSLHRFSFGIKRAVVELLAGAWSHCKSQRGSRADVAECDLKAAYASAGYLPFRRDVEALWRHSVGDKNIDPDLLNPLGVPSSTTNVVVAQAAVESFNRRVNEKHVEAMLTPSEREALENLTTKRKATSSREPLGRWPRKTPSIESLIDTFSRVGRES